MLDLVSADDAERNSVSLIVLHCLMTPYTPQQGEANNGSLYTVLKTVNTSHYHGARLLVIDNGRRYFSG
jgi:hypothetical protein